MTTSTPYNSTPFTLQEKYFSGSERHSPSTGKELDEETGYGYFGARYYDPTLLTSFLSIDRYADKYPSLSPYHYCAWNPVKLIDPSGDSLRLIGTEEQRKKVLEYLHRYSHLTFQCDERGYVTLNTDLPESQLENNIDMYISNMITDNENISVINLTETDYVKEKNVYMQKNNPTLFGGTTDFEKDDNGNVTRVEGTQYININLLGAVCGNDDESKTYPGLMIMHEFSEAYEGCKLARGMKQELTEADYYVAHGLANNHFFANFDKGSNGKYKLKSSH